MEVEAEATAAQLVTMGYSDPEKIIQRLQDFYASSRYRQLPDSSKQRVDALIPALIEIAARFPSADADAGAIAAITGKREPARSLSGAAARASTSIGTGGEACQHRVQWASEYLSRHPILLDELLNPSDFQSVPDWSASESKADAGIG